jgi:hypothetical protein
MRRIIELPAGTVKPKLGVRVGELDGLTHFCLVLNRRSASIRIGVDAQIAEFCREPLGALFRRLGALFRGFGSQICGFGKLTFPLIVITGQLHVAGKVKR